MLNSQPVNFTQDQPTATTTPNYYTCNYYTDNYYSDNYYRRRMLVVELVGSGRIDLQQLLH